MEGVAQPVIESTNRKYAAISAFFGVQFPGFSGVWLAEYKDAPRVALDVLSDNHTDAGFHGLKAAFVVFNHEYENRVSVKAGWSSLV